jgi:transglutaminase-like putative cysteine protease
MPLEIPKGLSDTVFVMPDFQLLYERPVSTKTRYTLRSDTRYRLSQLPPWMKKLALQLPSQANPRSLKLGRRWRNEETSDAAIVQRALSMFRDEPFYYTRQPPRLGANPVDEFLFTTRRGFCEHYASTFVTLMRAAGIPARIVTGYQGGELNNLGDYLIIRQSNAHAWAEVWLDKQGWVRVDPTAAIPRSRVETSNDATRFQTTTPNPDQGTDYPLLRKAYWKLRLTWDAIDHSWTQWVLGFDREKQRELLRKLGLNNLSWNWLIIIMFGSIAAVLAVIAGMTLLRRPRQRDPVAKIYQQWCDKLSKVGVVRRQDEGPEDFAKRARRERPELDAAIEAISRLYIRLRYARHSDGQDMQTLQRLVREFKT